ncbi:MAG: GNAT family N-acetyltransferase [Deltaproteobacteria bacterium]
MEIRELTLEDFNTPLVDSLKKLSFCSKDLSRSQMREVFLKRKNHTVTIVAVECNEIVGHVAFAIHWSFIGTIKATLFDFAIRDTHEGKWISFKMYRLGESILVERYKVNYAVGPVTPNRVPFYKRIGAHIEEGTVFMTKTILDPVHKNKEINVSRQSERATLQSKVKKVLKMFNFNIQIPG